MKTSLLLAAAFAGLAGLALAQQPDFPQFGGPGGPAGPGGPGGRGPGGMGQHTALVKDFDKDGDGVLNAEERKAARASLANRPARGGGRGFGRGGPFGGRGGFDEPAQPGAKVSQADVKIYGKEPLYDPKVLRTFFLEFDDADWEKEMADFYHTDVDVPAKLTVDGKVYPNVGVHFRGASSFMMVPEGRKRSIGISMNFMNGEQRLGGYRSLNLLNSHEDASYLHTVLYNQIAREYIPAPKTNFVRVVINGESWGIYVNDQQFNGEFTKEWFNSTKGARWKVPGSPGGRGGLAYLGEDLALYKRLYEIKTKDDPKVWAEFIHMTKVLTETPPDQLEKELAPLLDIDGALKFLALEKTFINNDGYWARASDFSIYEDEKGKFHIIPHDANETFGLPDGMAGRGGRGGRGPGGPPPGGPGFGPGGPGGPPPGGPGFGPPPGSQKPDVDPFAGSEDPNKALLSKLLAARALRTRYLGYMRELAEKWLDFNRLQPIAREYQALIAADVKADTRKLESAESFTKSLTEDMGGRGGLSLKSFAEQRRAYLLAHPEIQKLGRP